MFACCQPYSCVWLHAYTSLRLIRSTPHEARPHRPVFKKQVDFEVSLPDECSFYSKRRHVEARREPNQMTRIEGQIEQRMSISKARVEWKGGPLNPGNSITWGLGASAGKKKEKKRNQPTEQTKQCERPHRVPAAVVIVRRSPKSHSLTWAPV